MLLLQVLKEKIKKKNWWKYTWCLWVYFIIYYLKLNIMEKLIWRYIYYILNNNVYLFIWEKNSTLYIILNKFVYKIFFIDSTTKWT